MTEITVQGLLPRTEMIERLGEAGARIWQIMDICANWAEPVTFDVDANGTIRIVPHVPASVMCVNCAMELLTENALVRDGMPFCDEFCYAHYKKTMAAKSVVMSAQNEIHDKITKKMSAKGETYWDINVSFDSDSDVEDAIQRLKHIDIRMREEFI